MRKRNIRIQFWLDRKEKELLDKRVKRSGLSREAFLRHGIGRNLNQIAQKAHTLNVIDAQRYDEEVRKLEAAIRKITDAVILPMPLDR